MCATVISGGVLNALKLTVKILKFSLITFITAVRHTAKHYVFLRAPKHFDLTCSTQSLASDLTILVCTK